MSEQAFRIKNGGKFWSDALKVDEHRCRSVGSLRHDQRVAFSLNGFDLFHEQFETVEFAMELGLHMLGKSASVACSKLIQAFTPVATYRLIACNALPKEKTFDTVDVARPLDHQDLALTTDAPSILLLGTGRSDHRADAWLTPLVREQGANQCFAVDLVSLRTSALRDVAIDAGSTT